MEPQLRRASMQRGPRHEPRGDAPGSWGKGRRFVATTTELIRKDVGLVFEKEAKMKITAAAG